MKHKIEIVPNLAIYIDGERVIGSKPYGMFLTTTMIVSDDDLKRLVDRCLEVIADCKTEDSSEKPNNCEDLQDWKDRMWAEAIVTEPTISKMEQVDKDINVRSKDEPQTCETCKWGEWYRKGYDITMMDDECGGCCSWRSKWTPKNEPQTELKGSKRLVKGSDPCDGCIFDGHENVFACVACVLKDKQSGKE